MMITIHKKYVPLVMMAVVLILIVVIGKLHYYLSIRGINEYDEAIQIGSTKDEVLKVANDLYPGLRKVYYQGDSSLYVDIGTRFYVVNECAVSVRLEHGLVTRKRKN